MLKCSCACMFTCLDDHKLLCTHALMIICSHLNMPWRLYALMSTCFEYHTLTCLYAFMVISLDALIITWPHAHKLWCLHVLTCLIAHMSKCFDDCMLYVHMLWCVMFDCWQAQMLCWSRAFILTCFDDPMPPCLHALMIACSYAHLYWYSHVWYQHTCEHTWMMVWLYAWRLKWTCSWTFMWTNALTIVLEC